MKKYADEDTGIFSGSDFRNVGGGRTAVPGTSWLTRSSTPGPMKSPIPPAGGTGTSSIAPVPPQQNGTFNFPKPKSFTQVAGTAHKDWQPALPMKTAIFKFPLPVATPEGLGMPHIKQATGWGGTLGEGPWKPPEPPAPTLASTAGQVAKDTAVQAGLGTGLKALAAKALPQAAVKGTVANTGLWATPINAATDMLDYAGLYSLDQSKPDRLWAKPERDARGEYVLDQAGKPKMNYQFNPGAAGWFNRKEFNKGTTPDGTIIGGLRTGNAYIDSPLSYTTSGLRAANNPLKGSLELNRNAMWENNPLTQYVANPDERAAWSRISQGMPAQSHNTSAPAVAADTMFASQPWKPVPAYSPGGSAYDAEAERYKAVDRYHRNYNPEGQQNRPWFGRRWLDTLTR